MDLFLAQPRGFCAGVERAIDIVEKAINKYGPPIYVRHEIVHNKYVVDDLKKKGAIFVEEISDIPKGARTVFSAHGVSDKVEDDAKNKDLPVIDATCPLVTKVHLQAQKQEINKKEIIIIGHKGHPEVEGTSGKIKSKAIIISEPEEVESLKVKNPDNLAYVTQTTLSVDDTKKVIDALKNKFPKIEGPDINDICYATQNRQNAVRELAKNVDLILVIGAKNSSNSNRLRDLGEEMGINSYLIDGFSDINPNWLIGKKSIGITAGASAPEILVDGVIDYLKSKFDIQMRSIDGIKENIKFKLPKELR
ncbi:MAG: 4-hydroxy-3-methylbut-2-enyl diphosphate reductase [Rickettsiales bacterium]